MKRRTFPRLGSTLGLLALLPLAYFNCSKMSSAPGLGGTSYDASNALQTFTVTSDGTITIWQDKQLKYSPTGGAAGAYTISSLPAWAVFDRTTGTIVGVPRKLSDTATFTITDTGSGTTYGPFKVRIIGDQLKEQQWHLVNTGQTGYALYGGTAGADIHYTDSVANNYLGMGVRVAISDIGVYVAHADLAPNLLAGESRNYNNISGGFFGDPTPPLNVPDNAHGTAVTGLAVAKGWNGIGGRGVAPEARFAGFMFLSAQETLTDAGLITAAINDQFSGNFDVFNFSWGDAQCGFTNYDASFAAKLAANVATQRGGKGSVYVAAAGNSFVEALSNCTGTTTSDYVLGNSGFSELLTTPYTINVAAMNASGVSASYSTPGAANWITSTGGEYGWSKVDPDSTDSPKPALVTTDFPGCSIGMKTLDKDNSDFDRGVNNPDCSYLNTMNGTSGAAPTVTGAAAILLQVNPNLSWRDVKYILAKTADQIDPTAMMNTHPNTSMNLTGHVYEPGWLTNAAGFHFHNWYGFGRVNIDNAVAMAKAYAFPLGVYRTTGFRSAGAVTAAIPDASATGLTQTLAISDAMTIEAVQLKVSTTGCSGQLGLELTSPAGTKSVVMNINSGMQNGAIPAHTFLTNAFLGEASAGTWSLKVIDGRAGCTANLTNWQLAFHGH